MSKNKNKASRNQREEEQGKKVVRTLLIISAALAVLFILCYAIFS